MLQLDISQACAKQLTVVLSSGEGFRNLSLKRQVQDGILVRSNRIRHLESVADIRTYVKIYPVGSHDDGHGPNQVFKRSVSQVVRGCEAAFYITVKTLVHFKESIGVWLRF